MSILSPITPLLVRKVFSIGKKAIVESYEAFIKVQMIGKSTSKTNTLPNITILRTYFPLTLNNILP